MPNAAVDRRKWIRALGIRDTNGFGVKSEHHIQQAREWDVVVLKGNAFPGNEGECVMDSEQLPSQMSSNACFGTKMVVMNELHMHHKLVLLTSQCGQTAASFSR